MIHPPSQTQKAQLDNMIELEVFGPTSKSTECSSKDHQNQEHNIDQQPDDQATLLCCLRLNHELLRGDQGRYDILVHGPNHQGPSTLLTIATEAEGTSARCPSHQPAE